jgi:WD40 repeat protein
MHNTFAILTSSYCRAADHSTQFLITASIDGHIKLWKKQDIGIEFVKHYKAHMAAVVGVSASADGTLFASISEDGTAKIFDVVNFGASARVQGSDAQIDRIVPVQI